MKRSSIARVASLTVVLVAACIFSSEYLMREVHAQSSFVGIIYVTTTGNDSNNGFSWASPKATLAGALSALPNCTAIDVRGTSHTAPCGHIVMGIGKWTQTSTITIESPFISISGQSPSATQIAYTGNGCAIVANIGASGIGNGYQAGILEQFSITGNQETNMGTCGIESENNSLIAIRDVSVTSFTKTGDSCLLLSGGGSYNERSNFGPVWLGNCTTGWLITTPTVSGETSETLGYAQVNMFINVEANQTAVSVVGTSMTSALVSYDLFHIIVNSDSSTGTTCANFTYALWVESQGVWECDGPFANGFVLDANSKVSLGGLVATGSGANIVPSGADLWVTNVSGWPGNNYPFSFSWNGAVVNFQSPAGNTSNWINFANQSGTVTLH
jgi:hypothetical protein